MPLLYILSAICQALLLTFFKNNHKNLKDHQSCCTANYKFHFCFSFVTYIIAHTLDKSGQSQSEKFRKDTNSCKSLPHKDLWRRGAAPPHLSRCHQRTYGERWSGFRSVTMHFSFSIIDQSPRTTSLVTPES